MRRVLVPGLAALLLTTGAAASGAETGGRLVFVSALDDLDLFALSLDGGPTRELAATLANESGPALSPDGRTLAFTGAIAGRYELVLADPDGGNRRALTDDASYDADPAWSPDGKRIAWVSGNRLQVAEVADRSVRTVSIGTNLADPAWSQDGRKLAFVDGTYLNVVGADGTGLRRLAANVGSPSWSPDATTLVVHRASGSSKSPPYLQLVDVASGRMTDMPRLRPAVGVAPEWRPDGRIRFVRDGLWEHDPKTGSLRRLTSELASWDWTAAGSTVVFSRNVGGQPFVYDTDESGGDLRRVTRVAAASPVVSPDGRSLAFVVSPTRSASLFVGGRDDGRRVRVARLRRIEGWPTWSPDARRLAIGAPSGIFVVSRNGGPLRRVAGTRAGDSSPDWSPRAGEIAFVRTRRGSSDLLVVSLATGRIRVVRRNATAPDWSPDGRLLAFQNAYVPPYRVDVWTIRRDGGSARRLTRDGESYAPDWSPDGRSIAFVSDRPRAGDPIVWRVYTMRADGSQRRLVPGLEPSGAIDWTVSAR